jgi:tryptophan synthase alpha chain
MNGITGSALPDPSRISGAVSRIKGHTDLPVCVGFGVKTADHAKAIGASADGVVVGTAIVAQIAGSLTKDGAAGPDTIASVATLVKGLATGVRAARLVAAE